MIGMVTEGMVEEEGMVDEAGLEAEVEGDSGVVSAVEVVTEGDGDLFLRIPCGAFIRS